MNASPPVTRATLGGFETTMRRSGGEGTPTVFCHGNPSHSLDWVEFIERLEGPAVAMDMPNFGDSERPDPSRFGATMQDYAAWIGAAIDELGIDRFNLVVHDWGGIALQPAADRAERLERLVVINAVPLFAAYRWHWVARIWRRRGLGEALNATATRPMFRLLLRQARPGFAAMPAEWVDQVWRRYEPGTRRAVLSLYRSANPEALGAAGARLGEVGCPALVLWGDRDPYIGAEWGRAYARRLPNAELVELGDAGHWPWIDRPDAVARVCSFLDS